MVPNKVTHRLSLLTSVTKHTQYIQMVFLKSVCMNYLIRQRPVLSGLHYESVFSSKGHLKQGSTNPGPRTGTGPRLGWNRAAEKKWIKKLKQFFFLSKSEKIYYFEKGHSFTIRVFKLKCLLPVKTAVMTISCRNSHSDYASQSQYMSFILTSCHSYNKHNTSYSQEYSYKNNTIIILPVTVTFYDDFITHSFEYPSKYPLLSILAFLCINF